MVSNNFYISFHFFFLLQQGTKIIKEIEKKKNALLQDNELQKYKEIKLYTRMK